MTALSERELKQMEEKLKEHISEQIKMREFKPSLVEVLEAASETIVYQKRASKLTEFVGFLEDEEIKVPNEIAERADELEDQAYLLERSLNQKFDKALEEMNIHHMIKFAYAYLKYQDLGLEELPQFDFIVRKLTNEQKEKIYEILHSEEPKTSDDRDVIWRFEKAVGYSLAFAKKNNFFDANDEQLKPFIDFLDKYVTTYNDRIPARINWIKEIAGFDHSNPDRRKRYADGAVRGLGIATSLDDPKYMPAVQEFMEILEGISSTKTK